MSNGYCILRGIDIRKRVKYSVNIPYKLLQKSSFNSFDESVFEKTNVYLQISYEKYPEKTILLLKKSLEDNVKTFPKELDSILKVLKMS